VVADQVDENHARAEGWRLAAQIIAERREHPDEEIYLLAYSAGCTVVLSAAEALPPQIVDRIILLSASAPMDYDLRPALRCSRVGIDSFYSRRDRWCLGLCLRLGVMVGIKYNPAGGRFGFRPVVESPEDAVCYARLRQHPWEPEWEWAGNAGGHYGCHQPEFLRLFVVPLLSRKPQTQ
jgi:pimeloyl-ACP methyl ester carboxylesterase